MAQNNTKERVEKTYPKVGDELYIRQFTGSYYIDIIKRPYTVIAVSKTRVLIQACELVYPLFVYDPNTMSDYYKQFDGKRPCFFDTVAEAIKPDPQGRIEELTWHSRRGLWGTKGRDEDYPAYAIFGEYKHQPYLN